jgi:hypothetical protein
MSKKKIGRPKSNLVEKKVVSSYISVESFKKIQQEANNEKITLSKKIKEILENAGKEKQQNGKKV